MMRSMIKRSSLRWVHAAEGEAFCKRFNAFNRAIWRRPVRLDFESDRYRLSSCHSNIAFVFARKSRMSVYMHHIDTGVEGRLNSLAAEYMIADIPVSDGDVVVDCGANIGELGAYFTLRGTQVQYVAVEPSELEMACCRINNPGAKFVPFGLWKHAGVLKFFDKNDTGDSSLIDPGSSSSSHEIQVVTLDELLPAADYPRIRILKVEAEGAEPEVLEGGIETLRRTDYVCVDCGPERGGDAAFTITPVCRILLNQGFDLIDVNPKRFTCKFKRVT